MRTLRTGERDFADVATLPPYIHTYITPILMTLHPHLARPGLAWLISVSKRKRVRARRHKEGQTNGREG